jgi:4-amino-4-deoxy-L-arabinose transferase-like glycosyltransferase
VRARFRRLLQNRDFLAVLFLVIYTSLIYLPNIGSYAFWDPWEPHYSQVAKEMKDHESWMDTWYRGHNRWWSKPILPLWLLRGSFTVMGVDGPDDPWLHFAGRFPIFLMSLAGILLTFGWVSRLYNRRTGFYSALILSTCPMYAMLAHQIMFDMPFVSMCAAATGYYILARSPQGKPLHLYAFYILLGLAFLSKWLLAFFIPAGILFAFLVVRWDVGVFRRVGGWHWLASLGLLIACALYFFLKTNDVAFGGMLCAVVLSLLLVFWMGRDAAVEMGMGWKVHWRAFGCMMLIILPWHIFMIAKHGWPFIREAVIYHHFDRAAGTIGKPEGTFDVYIKQLAFALYPWVALLPAAIIRLLKWNASDLEGEGKRNLWVFLAAAVPWTAFSLFQTKFHHYIFPVVPFLAVIVGVFLARSWSETDRARMRLAIVISLPVAAVMLLDILHDYKWFVHMFDYYYGWPLPPRLDPYPYFGVVGGIWVLILGYLFFRRRVGTITFASMCAVATAVTVFLTAWIMPRVTRTFTQEPLYRAYMRESGGRAPVAQYNGWLSRSVSFYFDNRAVDLSKSDQPNISKAIEFLKRPVRSFMVLGAGYGRDCKSLLAALRPEVRKQLGKSLYVVFDAHPFSCLVSTERDPDGERRVKESILTEAPSDIRRLSIDFDGKIELLGYKLDPPEVDSGGSFKVIYYYRCKAKIEDDWLVFIHGDGPQGGSHRVFGDHAPMGGLYPTNEWKIGDIVKDEYEMNVPANYPYKSFTLWMGFWKGPRRMPVTMKHQHDGNNRVRTAFVRVK